MTSKMHRRNFVKGSLAMLAAGQEASLAAASAQQKNQAARPQQTRNGTAGANFFPGFKSMRINTSGATINAVVGGSGPPVLLLHGYPQTHVMWHKVAPGLAERFTVVAADLRGYGDSSKPADGTNHSNYSKRAMAKDQVEVMAHLGFEKFAVIGHDKGSGVASRMSLDYPDKITKLAVFDTLPSPLLTYRNLTKEWATGVYHWFFLVQPSPLPETMIANSVEFYLRSRFERSPGAITPEAFAEYLRASAIRPRFTPHAKTTAPAPASIWKSTRPIGTRKLRVRFCPCGPNEGIVLRLFAMPLTSGNRKLWRRKAGLSAAATLSQKRCRKKRWPN